MDRTVSPLEPLTSIEFARLARTLIDAAATECAAVGITMRSPGRRGRSRAYRRNDAATTISVRYRNRPAIAVAADMIEGIAVTHKQTVNANGRDALWLAAMTALDNEGTP